MKGRIKKNKATTGHGEALRKLGYEVAEDEEAYEVEITGVHEEPVDLTTDEGRETVQQVVADKKAFSYKTPFTIPDVDGQRSGIFAVRQLGSLSCLVVKPVKAGSRKPAVSEAVKGISEALGL